MRENIFNCGIRFREMPHQSKPWTSGQLKSEKKWDLYRNQGTPMPSRHKIEVMTSLQFLCLMCCVQVFDANFDRNTIVYQQLNPLITARYLRIRPTQWINHISMRVELYTYRGILTIRQPSWACTRRHLIKWTLFFVCFFFCFVFLFLFFVFCFSS